MRSWLLLLLTLLLAAGCEEPRAPHADGEVDASVDSERADYIEGILTVLPDWRQTHVEFGGRDDFGPTDLGTWRVLVQALSDYEIWEIEAVLARLARAEARRLRDSGPQDRLEVFGPAVHSNGFVLLRVMFVVPDYIARGEVEVQNPFVGGAFCADCGVPQWFPIGWPVMMTRDGEVEAIAPMIGPHGSLPDVVGEMRWFAERFERRVWD